MDDKDFLEQGGDLSEEFLEHYGILGMHWGRRSVGSTKNKGKPGKVISEDSATKDILKKKKLNQMTNAEIKTLNERLQLERTYKDLKKGDISPGRKYVTDILGGAMKQTLSAYIVKGMNTGVDQVVKKVMNQSPTDKQKMNSFLKTYNKGR